MSDERSQVRRERVSACLIVQNEHERLPAALESVAFCDEVIVVDGGSTDGTVALAREHGARVIESPWPGFARQRNVAIDAATSDWILEVDADEHVSSQLRMSIEAMLAAPPQGVAMAVLPRRNHFLGKPLGPSAQYPSYCTRLFRRDVYRHDESRSVHEGLCSYDRPLILNGDLEHELASTVWEACSDTWRYARLQSLHLPDAGALSYLNGVVLRPLAKLAYRLSIEEGWRDGWRGVLKVSLDAASDSLVWLLALAGQRRGVGTAKSEYQRSAPDGHFGRSSKGAAKIVAIASAGAVERQAAHWLLALRSQGLDVTLITDGKEAPDGLPVRAVSRLSPLRTIKALQQEMDLRTIDAVVPVGRRAQLLHRIVPGTLRPRIQGLEIDSDPSQAAKVAAAAVAGR